MIRSSSCLYRPARVCRLQKDVCDSEWKILPCERIGHQFSLGHITPEEIVLDIQGIADKYNGYYSRMEKRCGTCKNKELVYNACLI